VCVERGRGKEEVMQADNVAISKIRIDCYGIDMKITLEGFCEIEANPKEGFTSFINNL
jgi:hypothetical protein